MDLIDKWAKEQFGKQNKTKWNWDKYRKWLLKTGTRKFDVERIESFAYFCEEKLENPRGQEQTSRLYSNR